MDSERSAFKRGDLVGFYSSDGNWSVGYLWGHYSGRWEIIDDLYFSYRTIRLISEFNIIPANKLIKVLYG